MPDTYHQARRGASAELGHRSFNRTNWWSDSAEWRRWHVPSQDNVIEVHACRAGDVDLVDQAEPGNAERPPRQGCLAPNRQSDWKEYELGSDRCPRIKRSGDEDIYIVVAEA